MPTSIAPDPREGRLSNHNGNRLKLGMFGPNCSGGRSHTKLPERWTGNWDDCVALAQLTDDAGLDFILPVASWKGHGGGESDYHERTYETVTWAAGILQATRRMTVFGTILAPLYHPIMAAKQMVTADHIGHGRFALNLTCGWNPHDFEMFAGMFQTDHAARYRYGQEWLDIVRGAWTSHSDFDFEGEFITVRKVRCGPKPFGNTEPLLVSAASSQPGEEFAVRNFDVIFTATNQSNYEAEAAQIARIKHKAAEMARPDLRVFACAGITCRKTKKEAEEYHHHALYENADWEMIDQLVALYVKSVDGDFNDQDREKFRRNFALNGYGGFTIIGDADSVANDLARCSEVGIDGLAIHHINYLNEFPFFRDEVLPRLERLGIRERNQGEAP